MRVYFDNAATTPIHPDVAAHMSDLIANTFGNPSSIHEHGRKARLVIEMARKSISKHLNCQPSEIIFTSGGTESDNYVIRKAVEEMGIKTIISSKIEHHAVLNTIEELGAKGKVNVLFVDLDHCGYPNLESLESLLQQNPNALVSLMHANNELGSMIDLTEVGNLAWKYNALFHSDSVQTMCYFRFDMEKMPVDFIVGSAHKFNGPKGVGFLYMRHKNKLKPFLTGGGQERYMRAGTENIYGISAMAMAMDRAYSIIENKKKYIVGLRNSLIEKLTALNRGIVFNSNINSDNILYTVLNFSIPENGVKSDILLMKLDLNGISASGGSACSSGASKGSHVISETSYKEGYTAIRFSLGYQNTMEEVDYAVKVINDLL